MMAVRRVTGTSNSTVLRAMVKTMVDAKAEQVLTIARVNCPKAPGSGKLARTGRTRNPRHGVGRGRYVRSVVFGGARAPYALYVHEGTGPHVIHARHKHTLKFRGLDGDFVYPDTVHHPGIRGDPFLVKALVVACVGWRIDLHPAG